MVLIMGAMLQVAVIAAQLSPSGEWKPHLSPPSPPPPLPRGSSHQIQNPGANGRITLCGADFSQASHTDPPLYLAAFPSVQRP